MMYWNECDTADDDIEELAVICAADAADPRAIALKNAPTVSYLKNKTILRNLIIMGLVWSITWFCYYIFKF